MRLSQTRPSRSRTASYPAYQERARGAAPRWPAHDPATMPLAHEAPAPHGPGAAWRHPLVWRIGLGLVALVLIVAAVVAAIGPGRHLITHAAQGDPGTRAERHPAPQPSVDCMLTLPANPLSARGLATPFQLAATNPANGACHEANPDQMAFAQAAVFDPATSAISIYNPLVIDQGAAPAAQPVVPQLPANAVVALWFGFNGDNLRLTGAQRAANCVNGLGGSIFGQVSYCNAAQFFAAANAAIQAHMLTPPALGAASDGQACPTVRDFFVVDQDQSDNVTTSYLVTSDGAIAQNTAANAAALPSAVVARNGSDNGLLVKVDGALGCAPWMAPDLANPGQMATGLPLNELQAAAGQQAPVALTPIRDPMALVNGQANLPKLNLYRQGVDQPLAVSPQQADQDQLAYCKSLFEVAPARLQQDETLLSAVSSVDPATASNLFTFLAARFNFTIGSDGLNCTGMLHMASPITLTTDQSGVVTGAAIQPVAPGADDPTPGPSGGNGGGGNNGGAGSGASGAAPTCVVNGTAIQGCAGTATINGQSCAFTFDTATRQVTITCPQA